MQQEELHCLGVHTQGRGSMAAHTPRTQTRAVLMCPFAWSIVIHDAFVTHTRCSAPRRVCVSGYPRLQGATVGARVRQLAVVQHQRRVRRQLRRTLHQPGKLQVVAMWCQCPTVSSCIPYN